MAVDNQIEQHFRNSEKPFLQLASDWIARAQSQNRPILTSFLNSRETYLLETLINHYPDLDFQSFGGYSKAEMKRGLIFPTYFTPKPKDFELSLIKIDYPTDYAHLHHNQLLGSLMGSGLKRNVLGDILTDGEHWELVCSKHIAAFLMQNVTYVGSTKVHLIEVPLTEIIQPIDEWRHVHLTLPSFRLDVVISLGFKVSRSVAKDLIERGQVKLNWFEFNQPNHDVEVNDMISVRGYGRIKVNEYTGHSKKGKLKAEFGIIRNK